MAAEAPNSSPQYLQGGQQGDGARSFTVVCGGKTRGGGLKLKKGEVQSGYKEKKKKITVKITTLWNFSRPDQMKT